MLYSEKVMDHFSNPRNVGEIENANAVGEVGNPQCGDIMKIYMRINDSTGVIEDIKFKTFGIISYQRLSCKLYYTIFLSVLSQSRYSSFPFPA